MYSCCILIQSLLWSWKATEYSLVDKLDSTRRTGASGGNVGKISFFAIKLSTREHSATFHD